MYKLNNKYKLSRLAIFLIALCIVSQTAPAKSPPGKSTGKMPTFECLMQPDMVVRITSPINGILDEINVDNSDHVKKGDALARLESKVQKAAVAVANATAERQDEIELRKTDLAYAKRKLSRIKELHDNKSISPSEMDEAETAVSLAQIELQKAINNNKLAKLEYRKAKSALDRRTIRSPIDGIVVNRLASPGELTKDTPVFTIAKVDPLRVELIVPVEYFGFIKKGMKAHIVPEISMSSKLIATVNVVDKVIDAPSGTFSVRLSLPNPGNKLPGGLKCQANFQD